jgi:hypothetical protein
LDKYSSCPKLSQSEETMGLKSLVDVPPIEQIVEDWRIGMLATPPTKCPNCGKLTRAKYDCQWCKVSWGGAELELRKKGRLAYYSQYDSQTQAMLRHYGYYDVRVP